nr:tetraspanin family protein [Acinetobacter baumannii]
MNIIKYLTFFFNFLFVIFGIIFIVIGSLCLAGVKNFEKIGAKLHPLIILLIVLGCFILMLSFFGCCGAIKENYCMLMTFSTIIFLIFIIEIGVGIAAYVFRDKLAENIKEAAEEDMQNYGKEKTATDFWDDVQKQFDCCGVENYTDWENVFKNNTLPSSCCDEKNGETNCTTQPPIHFHEKGCFDALKEHFMQYSLKIGISALVIGFIQLLGIIFGCCLARSIKKEYETV